MHPLRNAGLKIVSVFLALLLWFVVGSEQPAERGLRVPLELRNLPPGIEVLELPVESVDARVRGASGALSRLSPGDLVATIDLQSARPGLRLFPITPEQVRVPFGVEVAQVIPTTLALRFETSASRTLPVAPSVIGDVAPGYVISRVTSDPAAVDVVGPLSLINGMSEVLTEPVSVDGAIAPVRQVVTVGAASPNVRLKAAQRATVVVTIVPAAAERTIGRVPVRLRNVSPGLTARVLPPVVSITVRGSQESLGRLGVDAVTVFMDLAGLGPGVYELPVRADPTSGFGVARTNPAIAQVVIE